MINELISKLIIMFDDLLSRLGFNTLFSNLVGHLSDFSSYTTEFQKYLSGVYFIFGKSLITYIVGIFALIITIRIIMAVVNLVGQFVP